MKTILDTTVLSKITSQSDMDDFVNSLNLKSKNVIIKPNWVDNCHGTYTDAKVLDLFLGSLKNKKIFLVESYTFWRNKKFSETHTDTFSSKEAELETGKIHWDFFKDSDIWYLESTGISVILEKHNATYINVTDKLWSGEESKIPLVPKTLYDLQGSDFISFAKLKGDGDYGATLSIKNIFGLIPDPHRMRKYHGENDSLIKQSILNINKTYRSLFNCIYIVEGVFNSSSVDWGNSGLISIDNQGIIVGGPDGVQVDHTVLKLMNRKFTGPLKSLLSDYQKLFGGSRQSNEIPPDYKIDFPKL